MEREKGGGSSYKIAVLLLFIPFAGGHPTLMCAQTGAGQGKWTENNTAFFIPDLGWHWRLGYYSIGAKKYDNTLAGIWRNTNFGFSEDKVKGNLSYPEEIFPRVTPGDKNSPFKITKCPYRYEPKIVDLLDPCDFKNKFEFKIYSVKQTGLDGVERALKGWFHIELKLLDPSDEFRIVYLQMRDEAFNAIGEFVMNPEEQCPTNDENVFVSPTNKQFLPCTATGFRETIPSQALYMVDPDFLVDAAVKNPANGYIPKGGFKRGIHFTWRFGEYWCNRHHRIQPDAFILTKRMIEERAVILKKYPEIEKVGLKIRSGWAYPRYIRKIPKFWFRPGWFGAHDVRLPSRSLTCNQPVVDDRAGKLTGSAPWIDNLVESTIDNDYLNPKYYYLGAEVPIKQYFYQSCQADPQNTRPEDAGAFQGRCKHLYRTVDDNLKPIGPSRTQTHSCNKESDSHEFEGLNLTMFNKYSDYVRTLQSNRKAACSNICRAPHSQKDVTDIQAYNDSGIIAIIINASTSNHTERTSSSTSRFWRGRKFHGILCIICSMFITPLSIFAARYYKETGMKHIFAGLQIWYWFHVASSLALFAIYFSSQTAIAPSIQSWGHSEDIFATFHYVLGWISHAIFTLMLVFGGIRAGIFGSSVKIRKAIMTAHSVVGFAQYWINLFLILFSTWIPSSPSAEDCDDDGLPSGLSIVFILTLTWAIVDTLMHAGMSFYQLSIDSRLHIIRPWYCPLVPVLPPDSTDDMKGSLLRQIVFIIYAAISGGFTLGTVLTIGLQDQIPGCVFGDLSCKNPFGCTSRALAICKKMNNTNCEW